VGGGGLERREEEVKERRNRERECGRVDG